MTTEDRPLVLVVDDDRGMRMLACASLNVAGFEVLEASTGAQALALLGERTPSLVLLDVEMPDLDGFEVCSRIRSTPSLSRLPVLMMTGLDDLASVVRAYEVGATDYATKPPNWIILGHRVRNMIRATQTAEELRRNEKRLTEAQRIARLGWWEWDAVHHRTVVSDQFRKLFGLAAEADPPIREVLLQRVHPEDRGSVLDLVEGVVANAVEGGGGALDHRIVCDDGSVRHVHQRAQVVLKSSGEPAYVLGTVQDITDRKQAEQQAHYLANYDGLTGLPNRRLFRQRLELAMEAARRHKRTCAVLFLDLDQFKKVNDTLGHTAGDHLLREVAHRIAGCLRSSDCVTHGPAPEDGVLLARLGGDEFIVLLSEITRVQDAARVGSRVVESLNHPFQFESRDLYATASLGIAIYPHDGETPDDLLKNADTAMYHAKERGRNNLQFYSESMNATALEKLELEGNLRGVLERQELKLHFQPLVDVATRKLRGAEGLLRWNHPEFGSIPPVRFIPLAEETGLIVPIGEWVLRAACECRKAWTEAGLPPFPVSVNVSGRQFAEEGFTQLVRTVLEETGLDPALLELELTESIVMKDIEADGGNIDELKSIGVRLSVDDFGTGYSSLSYLQRLPINTLKIDRSFLLGVPEEGNNTSIVTAIVALGSSLNLEVIAEGVETEAQAGFLNGLGCPVMQGYLIHRPMPSEDFVRWAQKGEALEPQGRGRLPPAGQKLQRHPPVQTASR